MNMILLATNRFQKGILSHWSCFYFLMFSWYAFKPKTWLYCALTLKERGGGAESAPLRHFLLYLCRLLFFRAETSCLFSFKPYARFKTIFIKIGPRVMTRRCVIARPWYNEKLIFHWNYTQIVFFVFFCLSGYTSTMFYLIYLHIYYKHTLTHIIAKKCNFCLKK